jgi:exopolysaccharide production protein ExoY
MANILSPTVFVSVDRRWTTSRTTVVEGVTDVANFILALAAFVFILPLLALIALAICLQDDGPVVFAHRRIGRSGRPFFCLKFRSMASDAEARLADLLRNDPAALEEWNRDHKLKNDPRITPLGRFLRKSSLDELPQLFNVLRGEMSLVGPRPIVDAEIPRYGRRFGRYCSVKPGITGLWQISGRNDVSYTERVAMDCLYAKSKSPLLDLWILAATLPAVVCRRGSY